MRIFSFVSSKDDTLIEEWPTMLAVVSIILIASIIYKVFKKVTQRPGNYVPFFYENNDELNALDQRNVIQAKRNKTIGNVIIGFTGLMSVIFVTPFVAFFTISGYLVVAYVLNWPI